MADSFLGFAGGNNKLLRSTERNRSKTITYEYAPTYNANATMINNECLIIESIPLNFTENKFTIKNIIKNYRDILSIYNSASTGSFNFSNINPIHTRAELIHRQFFATSVNNLSSITISNYGAGYGDYLKYFNKAISPFEFNYYKSHNDFNINFDIIMNKASKNSFLNIFTYIYLGTTELVSELQFLLNYYKTLDSTVTSVAIGTTYYSTIIMLEW